jgi:hypothetical protein
MRREIQNPQMFETDPESYSPAIYFKTSKYFLGMMVRQMGQLIQTHLNNFFMNLL